MSAIPTHDNAPANTGWFAVSVDNPENTSSAIELTEHMTLGVDDLGKQALTSSAATHACHVRSDRGMLRIEPLRGDVRVDGRVIGARALLSRSSVLRLGQHAFFISDSLLVEEPVEVVSELPGYWQPFMEELEAIPEPSENRNQADSAQHSDTAAPQQPPQSLKPQSRRSREPGQSAHTPALQQRTSSERNRVIDRRRTAPRRVRRTWLPISIAGFVTAGVLIATAIVADPAGTPAQLWRGLLTLVT